MIEIEDEDLKIVIAKEEYASGKKQLQKLETNRFSIQKKWLVAASIFIAVSLISLWFKGNEVAPKELYNKHFEPYANVIAPTTRNDNQKTLTEITFKHYESKNYQKAIEGFNLLLTIQNTDTTAIQFYKAISLLDSNNTSKSILILGQNININSKWKDKYLWYLSLAYLKNNQPKKALKTLKELSEQQSNFKKKETLMLLKSLKK